MYVKLFPYTISNGELQMHATSPIFSQGRGWLYTGYAARSKLKSDLLKYNEDVYSSAKSPNSTDVCVVGGGGGGQALTLHRTNVCARLFCFVFFLFFIHFRLKLKSYILSHL